MIPGEIFNHDIRVLQRNRTNNVCVYVNMHTYLHTYITIHVCVYICVCKYTNERERERDYEISAPMIMEASGLET